jgi:hypothetical protein
MKNSLYIVSVWMLLGLILFGQDAKMTSVKEGEIWPIGSMMTITWTCGPDCNFNVWFEIMRIESPGWGAEFGPHLPASAGKYVWKVGQLNNGETLPTGAHYVISMVFDDGHSYSGVFFVPDLPRILRVVKPAGNESFQPGDHMTIAWHASNLTGFLAVYLTDRLPASPGSHPFLIVPKVAVNGGPVSWVVSLPALVRPALGVRPTLGKANVRQSSSQFQIELVSDDGRTRAASIPFTIQIKQ